MNNTQNYNWTEDFISISSVIVPLILILLSILAPKNLANENQKETLLTAGLTALVTGGFRGRSRKTEITQEVQNQELNLGSSTDNIIPTSNEYVQYNPPQYSTRQHQNPYLAPVNPEDLEFIRSREHRASSPYKVVNPDD